MSAPYSVGYGKPPIKTQFKKGQSGNPKGRPKPKPFFDFQKKLVAELKSPMTVTEGGKKKKMLRMDVLLKVSVDRAIKGDKVMTKLLLNLMKELPKEAFFDEDTVFTYQVSQAQLDCWEQFLAETAAAYQLPEEAASSEQETNS